jgi:hypothetical protein
MSTIPGLSLWLISYKTCSQLLAYVELPTLESLGKEVGLNHFPGPKSNRFTANSGRRVSVKWKEFGVREHRGPRLVGYARTLIVLETNADTNTAVCQEELVSSRGGPSFSS